MVQVDGYVHTQLVAMSSGSFQVSLLGESLEMKLPSELAKEAKHCITNCFLLFAEMKPVFPCWFMAGDLSVPSTLQ